MKRVFGYDNVINSGVKMRVTTDNSEAFCVEYISIFYNYWCILNVNSYLLARLVLFPKINYCE